MTTADLAGLPPRPPITLKTKTLYGLGAAANIIKQRGITTFLLLFYNQVVGLPPAMVSTAIMFALIFDAFVDPLVGQISDNTRTRWGRRHPFMYAAAVPVSIAFYLIWNPPVGWENEALFIYMLVCLLTIRLFDTFFELPSSALLAELTQDYNQQGQLAILTVTGVVASVIGVTMAPKIAAKLGKRMAAITMFFGAVIALLLPIGLRIIGVMPANGTNLLFGILIIDFMANGAMAIMTGVMLQSMIADVVEDSEVKTGRRSEGLLFSADNLFKKIVSGVGVFVSGVLLAYVAFPQGAKPGQVDPEMLRNLALIYLPTIGAFYAVAITCLFLYRIDQTTHEENLRKLQEGAVEARTTDAQIESGSPAAPGPAGDLSPVTPRP